MIEQLRDATERMCTALSQADPAARVPACPGWTVDDLGEHLGRVHLWATQAVVTAKYPGDYPLHERGQQPLAEWYGGCAATLLEVLEVADSTQPAWTFFGEQVAGFWPRRQLHETTIHRIDAEQASGTTTFTAETLDGIEGVTPEQAADGVDEVLTVFMPRWLARRPATPPVEIFPLTRPVAIVCPDVDRAWTLRLEGGTLRVADAIRDPAATITGPATLTYLALWGRAPREELTLFGDLALARDLLSRQLTG